MIHKARLKPIVICICCFLMVRLGVFTVVLQSKCFVPVVQMVHRMSSSIRQPASCFVAYVNLKASLVLSHEVVGAPRSLCLLGAPRARAIQCIVQFSLRSQRVFVASSAGKLYASLEVSIFVLSTLMTMMTLWVWWRICFPTYFNQS